MSPPHSLPFLSSVLSSFCPLPRRLIQPLSPYPTSLEETSSSLLTSQAGPWPTSASSMLLLFLSPSHSCFSSRHGDLVFVSYQSYPAPSDSNALPSKSPKHPSDPVKEDPVDEYWRTQDGKIPRNKDDQFCKHGPKGMCDYCMPLEPYDAAHHKEHNIKYLSYHAYLRKIMPKQSASAQSFLPPLNPLSYRVKVPCPTGNHPSWPAGICTGCQPSTITLQSQPFRMVDHLEIASVQTIDRFLQAWRKSGLQRFGWLVGRYQPYDKVPMGVKAVVEAIYEPLQQGELDGLILAWPWEEENRIRELSAAASEPLTIVGYIFTDLTPTPDDRTKNMYKRHAQSFFLSSLEVIFAAKLQKDNPTRSRSSPTGQYGSRLVTAVLTATEDGQVDIAAYQVSEQAVAMVDADMIEASVDPGIVRVKEEDRSEDSARYIPDVFFSYKNEYGLEVKKSAKPCFPVEYLLVNVRDAGTQNSLIPFFSYVDISGCTGHTRFPSKSIPAFPFDTVQDREPTGFRRSDD